MFADYDYREDARELEVALVAVFLVLVKRQQKSLKTMSGFGLSE